MVNGERPPAVVQRGSGAGARRRGALDVPHGFCQAVTSSGSESVIEFARHQVRKSPHGKLGSVGKDDVDIS